MTPEDFREALDEHQRWIDTGGNSGSKADLRGSNLSCVGLDEVSLRFADLRRVSLNGDIKGEPRIANYNHQFYRREQIHEIDICDVDFRGCDIRESSLIGINFIRCNFSGADLRHCFTNQSRFENCIFKSSDIRYCELSTSTFSDCNFENSDMRGSQFSNRIYEKDARDRWSKSTFTGTMIFSSDFQYADLRGLNFEISDLYRCIFEKAYMENVKLPTYGIVECDFRGASRLTKQQLKEPDSLGESKHDFNTL